MRSALPTSLLLLLLTVACAGNRGDTASPPARARIENGTSLDMDIYIHRQSGSASRLGFVPASQTAAFDLPPALVAGAVTVRFEARPVRRSGRPAFSEPFGLRPGDELVWSIPPQ